MDTPPHNFTTPALYATDTVAVKPCTAEYFTSIAPIRTVVLYCQGLASFSSVLRKGRASPDARPFALVGRLGGLVEVRGEHCGYSDSFS